MNTVVYTTRLQTARTLDFRPTFGLANALGKCWSGNVNYSRSGSGPANLDLVRGITSVQFLHS